jgi:PAS domain S-box-containing protein
VNAAARTLLGLAEDEQIDMTRAPSFQLLDELGRPLPYEAWPEARLRRGETLLGEATTDVLFRARDGRTRYLSVSGAPVYHANGTMRGAVLVCHDVTERKRAEEHAQFLAEISKFLASSLDYEELALARQVGSTSVMIVPLVARSKILGVITFVSAESGLTGDREAPSWADMSGKQQRQRCNVLRCSASLQWKGNRRIT